jgi:hypothetical protein
MTYFRKAPVIAILVLAVVSGLSVSPSHAGQKIDPACVAPSLSAGLHERFDPEGEFANASRLKLQEKLKRPG